jgi:hypothetical protein
MMVSLSRDYARTHSSFVTEAQLPPSNGQSYSIRTTHLFKLADRIRRHRTYPTEERLFERNQDRQHGSHVEAR